MSDPKELRPLFAQWRSTIDRQALTSSAMKETSEVRYFISSLDVASRNSPPQCVSLVQNKLH